jgi:hypothetical protein
LPKYVDERIRWIQLTKDNPKTIYSSNGLSYFLFTNFSSSYESSEGYVVGIILDTRFKVISGTIPSTITFTVSANYILTLTSNITWGFPVIILGRTQMTN